MKKIFLLIASSVLLLAGCTKESKLSDTVAEGETVTVKVMAQLENAVPATKASWDNDGNGAKVDHWILEVYDAQGMLFDRQEKENQTGLTNSFEVILVKNQTYEFAFWADTKGAYKTDDLHTVAVNYTKVGLDSQDAFFADEDDYVSKKSETVNVTLRRPLAQLNIVSLDFKKIYEQMEKAGTTGDYDKFCPVDLELKGDIYNMFNVLDSTASDKKSSTFSLDSCYANYMAHKDTTTIFMCYGFAAADKEIYNLEFSFKSNSVPIEYGFNNIPLQRNYRTNIFGNLLSNDSEWNVVIDPVWETPDTNIVPVVSVSLDKSEMTLFVGDDMTLVATALPENATDPSVVWSSSDEKVATVDEDGKVKAVAIGTATITATSKANVLEKATCTVTVDHEFVEMAGLKWATCNIGAENPTKAGWYFSWGNIDGYVHNGSQWVSASDGTPLDVFKKSIYESTVGYTLSSSIAPGSGHDAARENWGMDWRMPSSAEFQALYEACGGEGSETVPEALTTATPVKGIYWLTSDQAYFSAYTGVAGLLFVDENKTRLFFPVTGYGNENAPLKDDGISGRYWSSTLADKLYFLTTEVCPKFDSKNLRYRGYAIRPVKDIDE